MAHDLIAYHYLHTSPPIPQQTISPAENISFYSVFDVFSTTEGAIRSWLFISDPEALANHTPLTDPVHQLLGENVNTPFLSINSYDRRIMDWVNSTHFNRTTKKFGIHLLYEMKLATPPASPPPLTPGFRIQEDVEWWVGYQPKGKWIISDGGEKVYTAVEVETGERAAVVTVLSKEGRMYVSSLETFEKYRRKGLAAGLMRYVEEVHKTDGGGEMWLTVFCENVGAVGLYHRLGWKINRCLWVVNYDDKVAGGEESGGG